MGEKDVQCANCVVIAFRPFTLAGAGNIEDVDVVLVDEIGN